MLEPRRPLNIYQLAELLGDDLFERLIGRRASVLIASADQRSMPRPTERRVRFLGELCACLVGSFTTEGVRAWFDRPRVTLDRAPGAAPADYLWRGQWQPEDADSQKVLELARSLIV